MSRILLSKKCLWKIVIGKNVYRKLLSKKKISIENCDQQNVHRNLLSKKCVLKFVSEKMSIENCYRKKCLQKIVINKMSIENCYR